MLNNLQKYTVAKILMQSMWWVAVAPLFYMANGLTIEEVLILIGIFSLAVVLAEYPTGIIADAFSHKQSVLIGSFITAIAWLLILSSTGFYFYIAMSILLAIGSAMRSGSDVAILHKISKSFKKDLAHTNSLALLGTVITTAFGAYAYTIHINIPFILTSFTTFIAIFFFASVKIDEKKNSKESGNIYKTALDGLKNVKNNNVLKITIIFSGAFLSFFYSIKWLAPILLDAQGINSGILGTIISVSILLFAFTTKLSGTKYDISLKYVIPALLLGTLLLGFGINIYMITCSIMIIYFFRGFFSTHMTVLINQNATDDIRASTLSLQSLACRVCMSIYLFIGGKVAGLWSLSWFLIFTFFILSILSIFFGVIIQKNLKKVCKSEAINV